MHTAASLPAMFGASGAHSLVQSPAQPTASNALVPDYEVKTESSVHSVDTDDMHIFKPPYVMGVWENDDEDKRVSVAILIPSGSLTRNKDHFVRVIDDGETLEIGVIWPRALTDVFYLHRSWTHGEEKMAERDPRIISFRSFLRRLRNHTDEAITSTARISLPFKVKCDISVMRRNTFRLNWRSSTERILYVTLEAPDRNYIVQEDAAPVFRTAD